MMMKAMATICILAAGVHAWGEVGHRVVAALADRNSTASIVEQFQRLLPDGATSLADVSNWADEVKNKHEWHWTERLHYADTPSWQCYYETKLDCPNGCDCVVGAIANYTRRLQMPEAPSNNRTVDLMLLVHLVGDLAQPLHVGFEKDRGGNEIHGEFCGRETNLHALWDEGMIERRLSRDFGGSEKEYIDHLWQQTTDDVELCSKGDRLDICLERWASDSASLACEYAYVDEQGSKLKSHFRFCEQYYDSAIEIVEQQLIVGGSRLAYLLGRIFQPNTVITIESK